MKIKNIIPMIFILSTQQSFTLLPLKAQRQVAAATGISLQQVIQKYSNFDTIQAAINAILADQGKLPSKAEETPPTPGPKPGTALHHPAEPAELKAPAFRTKPGTALHHPAEPAELKAPAFRTKPGTALHHPAQPAESESRLDKLKKHIENEETRLTNDTLASAAQILIDTASSSKFAKVDTENEEAQKLASALIGKK
ncbi:hypothetical protein HYV11_03600 [Candidatus Dependentiae bacterium]|nr:hypothetical protein [Candidatus Dependentiae bacterium]